MASSQLFGLEIEESAYARPIFVQGDVLDTDQDFEYGPFDLILSNPPYVKESEKGKPFRGWINDKGAVFPAPSKGGFFASYFSQSAADAIFW